LGATAQPLKPTAGTGGARQADRINTLIPAETNFIVGGINIYTIAKRAPT